MKRNATAVWKGTGKEGKGVLTTQSKTLEDASYSYHSRFEEGKGTNPEELIAAAHAGCFCMKLSFGLSGAGYEPEKLDATCTVTLDDGSIKESFIKLDAHVKGISKDEFDELVKDAKENCPISKSLNAEIKLEAKLTS